MTKHIAIALARAWIEKTLEWEVKVVGVAPTEDEGWIVVLEHAGVVWEQTVSPDGELTCFVDLQLTD